MPIFVSRFSPARAGLVNFLALRTPDEDARPEQRATTQRERVRGRDREEDQTRAAGEDRRGAFRLLVTSQRADQVAQRVTGQAGSARRTNGGTTTSNASQAARRAAAAETTQAGRAARGGREVEDQDDREDRVERGRRAVEADVNLRPVLRSAIRRIDNLTRLISAQRRDQTDEAEATARATRVRLATSLRIEQTNAQTDVVRTAQAARTTRTTQAAQAQPAQQPRTEDRLKETPALKQTLREGVASVARGLVGDAVLQNAQNARRTARTLLLQAESQQARQRTASLSRPIAQRTPVSQGLFSTRQRPSPTIPNLSPLRSALALLGTNVNILVG